MSDEVEAAEIVIRHVLREGESIIALDATEDLSVMEGLGMIELAKDTWLRTNGLRDDPDR